jgi:hypothetical protein
VKLSWMICKMALALTKLAVVEHFIDLNPMLRHTAFLINKLSFKT